MKGRTAIFEIENMQIGDRLEITGDRKRFAAQYAHNFSNQKRSAGRKFKSISQNGSVFIERTK